MGKHDLRRKDQHRMHRPKGRVSKQKRERRKERKKKVKIKKHVGQECNSMTGRGKTDVKRRG